MCQKRTKTKKSALSTPAFVNTSTILPSTTTYLPPHILLIGIGPVATVDISSTGHASLVNSAPAKISTSTDHASLVNPSLTITYTSTGHASLVKPLLAIILISTSYKRELLNLGKTYTDKE